MNIFRRSKITDFLNCIVKPFHATSLFLYPLKNKKTSAFLFFSGGIERNRGMKWGYDGTNGPRYSRMDQVKFVGDSF